MSFALRSFQSQPGVIVQQGGAVIVQQLGSASPIVQKVGSPVVQSSAPPAALVVQQTATVVQQNPSYPVSPPAPGGSPLTSNTQSWLISSDYLSQQEWADSWKHLCTDMFVSKAEIVIVHLVFLSAYSSKPAVRQCDSAIVWQLYIINLWIIWLRDGSFLQWHRLSLLSLLSLLPQWPQLLLPPILRHHLRLNHHPHRPLHVSLLEPHLSKSCLPSLLLVRP